MSRYMKAQSSIGHCLALFAILNLAACGSGSGSSSDSSPGPASASSCGPSPALPPARPASSFLSNDTRVHMPPVIGQFAAYNDWSPCVTGFPAVGDSYVDPVFGGTVRRLTNTMGFRNQEDIYGHHWANADGTLAFSRQGINGEIGRILSTTTGHVIYDDQPGMSGPTAIDIAWDAIDRNVYYYYSGSDLIRRDLAAQPPQLIDTIMKTFPAPLEPNGGSLNTQDRSGQYFTVRYDDTNNGINDATNKVWDSQADIIYSGAVTPLNPTGWVAITPDGKYLVTAAGRFSEAPNIEHYSYEIDHVHHTILPTPTQFWGLCGDHGALISASDGHNYFITHNCTGDANTYRVDITLNQAGKTEVEQIAANQVLLQGVFDKTGDGHLSAVSKGPNQDWVFADIETFSDDPFNGTPSGWAPYEQEIVAINVVKLEVRRYAHHRSRGLDTSGDHYYAQPRISCSWDGSVVLWTSNFNVAAPVGYADLYAMSFP